MTDIAVKFENVSKYYKLYNSPKDRLKEALHPFGKKLHREFYALKKINLEVKKGEILGIVGRNGCGKSTLLKIISNVIQPNSGKVTVNGKVSALLDLGAGMNPDYDGMQNIYFGGIMIGFSREEMKAKVDEIIAFAEIGNFIYQPLKTYSSGMKARLGFALAISVNPEILVVDEVLAVGDDLFKRKCFDKMGELFKTGCTVFFVSHSVPNVNELCTRTILLDNGELILEGPAPMVTYYFHTLLYAPPATQKEIRDEIIQLNMNQDEKAKYERRMDPGKSIYLDKNCEEHKKILDLIEVKRKTTRPFAYFIPNFIPKTTKKHEFYDVKIFDLQIQSLSGEVVNALVMDEIYIFSCKIKFTLDIDKVQFAMLIQSIRGLALSGISIQSDDSYTIKTSDIYLIQIRFKCALRPGTYFISISLNATDKNGEKIRLYAIDDATVFNVQQEKDNYLWGTAKMEQTGQIQKISGY